MKRKELLVDIPPQQHFTSARLQKFQSLNFETVVDETCKIALKPKRRSRGRRKN